MEQGKKWRQFLAAILSNLSSVATGTCLGWTSAAESKMKDLAQSPLSSIPSTEDFSWISSLTPLGALIGPYIAGPLTSRIGRKWTLLASSVFFIASFIILIFANSVALVFVARILQGLGVGFVMTAQTMYVGEISSDDSRGALGSFMQLGIVIGILYVYCVGPYVSFQTYQCLCLIIPIAFVATFFFMPDSPHYYIQKGQEGNAVKSLKFLRGKSTEGVQQELDEIRSTVEESMKNKGSVRDVFTNSANKKAFIISAGLLAFQQLSGINVVLFYCQSIFETAGSSLKPAIATIIVGIVMVISSACTPLIVDRLGRKVILLFSAAGMTIALALLGMFFLLDHNKSPIAESIKWLPIVSLIAFVFVYCVGFGPLPWAVLGEMFAPSIKPVASSLATSVCWIVGFAVTKWFSLLQDVIGSYGAFWLFGGLCAVAFVFTLTFVMETKGCSLQEIQDRLNGRK
ncbi:facilitated trehalose transporter Tret1 [Chironomus tepperi]|uniref:facilitated trehalose transporter Tret1 n=1 Tax=Chironomus tepperi TaxID=113505 RepID=UPI00391F8073